MKPIQNYESVQASSGEFARPSAGGYICRIVNVENVPMDSATNKGDYLRIEYDIVDGQFAGYYKEQFDRWGGKWNASFVRSYKEKALGMFKHFITCVEESNTGYEWDWNETGLINKEIGLVLGEEEYRNNMGDIRTKLVVRNVKNVSDIEDGNFKIPEFKKFVAPANNMADFVPLPTDDDVPF